jgi:aspartyl-tRNA(Asn)/glutamyl-tRNA(Gln) amidotransferase subunit A
LYFRNYGRYFSQALKLRRLIKGDFDAVFNSGGIDVLLTPVTLTTAPKYSEFVQWDNRTQCSVQDYCTQSINLHGGVAISLPVGVSSSGSGLPISLQLMGGLFQEKKVFQVAKRVENIVQFTR